MMNFDDILQSVSFQDLTSLQSDNIRLNIAAFARWIANGHAGWHFFSKDVHKSFRYKIEKLYEQAEQIGDLSDLSKRLSAILLTTIPDGHIGIKDSTGRGVLTMQELLDIPDKTVNPIPETHVGKNIAYTSVKQLTADGFQVLDCQININQKPLLIMQHNNIGIVAFSSCLNVSEVTNQQWQHLKNTFAENWQKWDGVIIDVRGNRGGDSSTLDFIAETLYGNRVPYSDVTYIRNTPEAYFIQDKVADNYLTLTEQVRYQNNLKNLRAYASSDALHIIACDNRTLSQKYPFRPEKELEVRILTDRHSSSAGEGIVNQLKFHPYCKTVGENTCGINQYGHVTTIALPCQYQLTIGSLYRFFNEGPIEGIGFTPTISTIGQDAFTVAWHDIQTSLASKKVLLQQIYQQVNTSRTNK
ncbi:MAG: hypothetical protein IJY58_06145 [Alphaproteobacteria bacterium]|nr:hypothetical protein [Alphaproteobacteria bacterium]